MTIGNGLGQHFGDIFEMYQAKFMNPNISVPKKEFSDEGGPAYPPPNNGDMDMWNTDQRPPEFMKTSVESDLDQDFADIENRMAIDNPERHKFYSQSGKDFIQNIEKAPGLFGPLAEEMAGPTKKYLDTAKQMTRRLYDLYKSGDVDVVEAVQDYENRIHGRGFTDDEIGNRKKAWYQSKFGSKTEIRNETLWDLAFQMYSGAIKSELENENLSDKERQELEDIANFDQEGRPTINISPELQKKLFGIK